MSANGEIAGRVSALHAPSIPRRGRAAAIDGWDAPTPPPESSAPTASSRRTARPTRACRWASVTKLLTGADAPRRARGGDSRPRRARRARPARRSATCSPTLRACRSTAPSRSPSRAARRIYSNTGIELAAELLAERAEMPFADYFARRVAEPLGLRGRSRLARSRLPRPARRPPRARPRAPRADARRAGDARRSDDGPVPGPHRRPAGPRPDGAERLGPGFELRDGKSPHWTGTRELTAHVRHFGRSGTFLWVDPDAGLACGVLTAREFGDWAKEAWPAFSDAVLGRVGSARAACKLSRTAHRQFARIRVETDAPRI